MPFNAIHIGEFVPKYFAGRRFQAAPTNHISRFAVCNKVQLAMNDLKVPKEGDPTGINTVWFGKSWRGSLPN